jgi:hypothetical protein
LQLRDTVTVTVEQPFTHEAPVDVSFCPGECFDLGITAVSGLTYSWLPTNGLSDPSKANTKAQPSASTIYTLHITNPAMRTLNCREQEFVVIVTQNGCNYQSFIAVNGDAVSEVLDLGTHAGRVELRVWDMAGRYVFRSMDYMNNWDAASLGHGIYVYRVSVTGDCPSDFIGRLIVLH